VVNPVFLSGRIDDIINLLECNCLTLCYSSDKLPPCYTLSLAYMARVSPAVGLLSTPATARWDHGHLTSIQLDVARCLIPSHKKKTPYTAGMHCIEGLLMWVYYVAVLAADDWADITVVWHCVYLTSGTLNTCEHIVLSAPTNDVNIAQCHIAIFIKERY